MSSYHLELNKSVPVFRYRYFAISAKLNYDISNGGHVVVHCRAGIGRTGVIAGAVLILAEYSYGEPIHLVSFARGSLVPDTEEQDNWIRSIERSDS